MGLSAASSRGLLPTNLTLFSCTLQLPISLSMDLLLAVGEHGSLRWIRIAFDGWVTGIEYTLLVLAPCAWWAVVDFGV
jgi:hypothetical protein